MEQIRRLIFKDIMNVIYRIKRCRSKSMEQKYSLELCSLYYLCDELGIDDYPKIENYSTKNVYKNDLVEYKMFLDQFENNFDYHIEFSKNVDHLNEEIELKREEQNVVCMEETIDITTDFLCEFDPFLAKIFKRKLNDGRIILNGGKIPHLNNLVEDDSSVALTIHSYGSFSPYVVLNFHGTIQDASSLSHEIGHCYIAERDFVNSYHVVRQKKINHFVEVYPYFINFCFHQYCIKNRIYISDSKIVMDGYNQLLIPYLTNLKQSLEGNTELDYYDLLECLDYNYGISIALHFYDRYLRDPEKTKREMNQFIEDDGNYRFMEMLERYHLKEELIHSKVLKKYLNKEENI